MEQGVLTSIKIKFVNIKITLTQDRKISKKFIKLAKIIEKFNQQQISVLLDIYYLAFKNNEIEFGEIINHFNIILILAIIFS